jgi:hypothetical protein
VAGRSVLYTATWRKSGDVAEIQLYDANWDQFKAKYDSLWNQGWRLHLLSNYSFNGSVYYTAVWRVGGNIAETQVYGWNYNDFRKQYDDLWSKGWRLHLLSNFVHNGTILYSAVWRQGTFNEIQAYAWNYADVKKKYDEIWGSGYRLYLINNFKYGNQILYTAVWRQTRDLPEVQVYGWSYEDFRKLYDQLWCDGWRLKNFDVF